MALPADSHVHSEWSWDAPGGSMELTCRRALEIGLPAVAFTEHADHTVWQVAAGEPHDDDKLTAFLAPDGTVTPPALDLDGYLESVQRCREQFPGLRVISGVEIGEPHLHGAVVAGLLAAGRFDRVLGSLHCLPVDGRFHEVAGLYRDRPAGDVVRAYLGEVARLVQLSDAFAVLAHIDYPVRDWPAHAGPFDPDAFEDEYRHALGLLAAGGRALEVNTRVPLHPRVVRWWREEGGTSVTFGSDAHDPDVLALGFRDAAALVQAHGFRPGRHPWDVWTRRG